MSCFASARSQRPQAHTTFDKRLYGDYGVHDSTECEAVGAQSSCWHRQAALYVCNYTPTTLHELTTASKGPP